MIVGHSGPSFYSKHFAVTSKYIQRGRLNLWTHLRKYLRSILRVQTESNAGKSMQRRSGILKLKSLSVFTSAAAIDTITTRIDRLSNYKDVEVTMTLRSAVLLVGLSTQKVRGFRKNQKIVKYHKNLAQSFN